jgi:hypothetical protein
MCHTCESTLTVAILLGARANAIFNSYRDKVFLAIGEHVPIVGEAVAEFGTKKLNGYIGSLEGPEDGIQPEKGLGGIIWAGIVTCL